MMEMNSHSIQAHTACCPLRFAPACPMLYSSATKQVLFFNVCYYFLIKISDTAFRMARTITLLGSGSNLLTVK